MKIQLSTRLQLKHIQFKHSEIDLHHKELTKIAQHILILKIFRYQALKEEHEEIHHYDYTDNSIEDYDYDDDNIGTTNYQYDDNTAI